MDKAFLSFLNNSLPYAALCARKMEEIFFTDPSGAIAKARLYIEDIIKKVWEIEGLDSYSYSSLNERINFLHDREYITVKIYQSFDVIRRAGNKASHDATYNDMNKTYTVHKEMYNIAVWYFEVYTNEELILPPYDVPKPKPVLTEEEIEMKLAKMLEAHTEKIQSVITPVEIEPEPQVDKVKPTPKHQLELLNGSYLEREISRLRISAAEAVENAQSFSDFKNYLHVKRPIQEAVEAVLAIRKEDKSSNLILLCGSVGDGKSHLLAYLNRERKDLINGYKIYNDATESFSPNKTALETLEEILKNFSDQHFEENEEKVIIAINLGVLHNFVNYEHKNYTYNKLREFIEKSGLFTSKILTHYEESVFDIVSFADYQVYELTPSGIESNYLSTIMNKICMNTEDNPFYLAYKKDLEENRQSIIHENYRFLMDEFVQHQIVRIVVQSIIQFKISLSSRHFLNFLADLIIPNDFDGEQKPNEYQRLAQSLPNILFNSSGRSQLLDIIGQLNPIHYRTNVVDELLVTLNTLTDWQTLIDEKVNEDCVKDWLMPFAKDAELIKDSFELFVEHLVSTLYLTDALFAKNIQNPVYNKYIEYVYAFNKRETQQIKAFYKNLKTAIFSWRGTPLNDYIYLEQLENELAIAQKLKLNAKTDHLEPVSGIKLQSFKPFITVKYTSEQGEKSAEMLEIDYSLYQLLYKVANGYRPNKKDEEEATTFIEFLDKIMLFGDKSKEMMFNFLAENSKYRLKFDEFDGYVFEKVE